MSDVIYSIMKEEVVRLTPRGEAALVPSPFEIRRTYVADRALALFKHPGHSPLELTGDEATALAGALRAMSQRRPRTSFDLVTEVDSRKVALRQGGHHISIKIDSRHVVVVRPVALDLANALSEIAPNGAQNAN